MATILLVDDVQLFLELEKSFLEDSGHRVLTARSGEEALLRLEEACPDLLLLDLYMPGIDGDEVCRRLRAQQRWQSLPVLMVTAAGKDDEVRRCLDAGCDDYTTKPINKKDLLEKAERLLGRVKARTAQRVEVSLRVQVEAAGQSLATYARDLSSNGIYIKSQAVLAPGTAVELKLSLPDGRDLPVLGVVKRVKHGLDSGMGIYFVNLEPQGKRALAHLMQQQAVPVAAPPPQMGEAEPQPLDLAGLLRENADLRAAKGGLLARIAELEEENREFAGKIVHAEEVNNNLANLYVAASRLHAVLDQGEVLRIVQEVVINFVGAEKFALLLREKDSQRLVFAAGEGVEAQDFPELCLGEGLLGKVALGQDSYCREGDVSAGSDDLQAPIAAIPLHRIGQPMGVLAIYRLLTQKERFEAVDFQLFGMLAEHAAMALFSATLYGASERKRETYRGLMDLLLK